MNSALRILHETHDQVLKGLGIPLQIARNPSEAGVRESVPVQEAGQLDLDNSLEADFYNLAEKSVRLKWDHASGWWLKNVYVVGDTGQIFLEDGRLFLPTFHPHEHLLHRMKVRRPIKRFAQKIDEPVYHLTGRNHENRGHFLMQHLPRLLAGRQILDENPDCKILLAPGHVAWQSRYLEMTGFHKSRVLEGSRGTLFIRHLFYVPHIYGSHALARPDLCRAVRDAALQLVGTGKSGAVLFISRLDAPDKRLVNEIEIVEETRRILGQTEVIQLGKYNLSEQIKLFSGASVVLGPIGQGLCNNIFMKNNLLISLVSGESVTAQFSNGHSSVAAQVCGNQGITLYSGITENEDNNRGNWVFPVGRFREQLQRLINMPHVQSIKSRLV